MIVKQAPRGSAVDFALRGEEAHFDETDYLLVAVLNTLRILSWQTGGDPKAPKPAWVTLPGMDDPDVSFKGKGRTIEEVDRILGWDKNRP